MSEIDRRWIVANLIASIVFTAGGLQAAILLGSIAAAFVMLPALRHPQPRSA